MDWWFPPSVFDPPDQGDKTAAESMIMDLNEQLFQNQQLMDVTFKLQDGEVCAHQSVLAAGSSAFAGMFTSSMKEKHSGVVELPSVKQATMKVLLRLLYTGHV